jgi:hypothetical protein
MVQVSQSLKATISLEPWYTRLIESTKTCLVDCIEDGMPSEVAADIIKHTIETATLKAVKIETKKENNKIGF